MSCTTPLLRDDRFAAQLRVGCATSIGDYFVYAAMKCCIVGSWKSGSTSTYLSVSLNVKYRRIRDKSVLIIRPAMEDFVSWLCAVKKWICFYFRQRWKSFLANSRPRFVYKNVFSPPLFRIFTKALRIDLFILFFSCSAHAKFENFQRQSTPVTLKLFQLATH